MYIHLGEDVVVCDRDIIGIFDLERTSISKHTREFLKKSTKAKKVVNVSYAMPKTFIVCKKKVYISQIASSTIKGRGSVMAKKSKEREAN